MIGCLINSLIIYTIHDVCDFWFLLILPLGLYYIPMSMYSKRILVCMCLWCDELIGVFTLGPESASMIIFHIFWVLYVMLFDNYIMSCSVRYSTL